MVGTRVKVDNVYGVVPDNNHCDTFLYGEVVKVDEPFIHVKFEHSMSSAQPKYWRSFHKYKIYPINKSFVHNVEFSHIKRSIGPGINPNTAGKLNIKLTNGMVF